MAVGHRQKVRFEQKDKREKSNDEIFRSLDSILEGQKMGVTNPSSSSGCVKLCQLLN